MCQPYVTRGKGQKKKHPLEKKRWRNAASRNKNATKDGSDAASERAPGLLHYHTGLTF